MVENKKFYVNLNASLLIETSNSSNKVVATAGKSVDIETVEMNVLKIRERKPEAEDRFYEIKGSVGSLLKVVDISEPCKNVEKEEQ
jgi:hypothetical protein